jgi:hypothetical protein
MCYNYNPFGFLNRGKMRFIFTALLCLIVAAICAPEEYLTTGRHLADLVNEMPSSNLTGPVGILTLSGYDLQDFNKQRLWNNYDRAMERRRVSNFTRIDYEKKMKDAGLSEPLSRSYQQYSSLAEKMGYKGWVGVLIVDDGPGPEPNLAVIAQVVRASDNLIATSSTYAWNEEFYQQTALDIAAYRVRRRFRQASEYLRIQGYKKIVLAPAKMADGSNAQSVYNAKLRAAMARSKLDELGINDVDGEPLDLDKKVLQEKYDIDAIVYPQVSQKVVGSNPKSTILDLSISLVDVKNGKEAFSFAMQTKSDFYPPKEYRQRVNSQIARNSWIGGSLVLTGVPVLILSSFIERYPDYYDPVSGRTMPGGWKTDSPLVYVSAVMEITGFAFLLQAGYLMLE